MTDHHPVDDLDEYHFEGDAFLWATILDNDGVVSIVLEPGDMTQYRLVLAQTADGDVIVALTNWRRCMVWSPRASDFTHWTYPMEHMDLTNDWTARIVARLLNAIRPCLMAVQS